MKSLSIKQPWAYLIVNGPLNPDEFDIKDIENRSWKTKFRGEFYVHASKKFDKAGYERLVEAGVKLPKPDEYDFGGIIGKSNVVDCVDNSESFWFSGPYGFKLKDSKPLPFKPVKGKLYFFEPSPL